MHAHRSPLSDGRWHFQHGPIDITIGAEGQADAVQAAHAAAWRRFETVLQELVAELPILRQPLRGGPCPLHGRVAQRMWAACRPYRAGFITAMASVAGAVAQELIEHYQRPGIARAWVNNGGDIALHLAPGQSVRVGLYADLARLDARQVVDGLDLDGHFDVGWALPVRGLASSGWRGRSFSLGIADTVTVLARSAAEADAAATVIGNAVAVEHPGIVRRPARELRDDSDLGAIAVTVDVARLPSRVVRQALLCGLRRAQELRAAGLIWSAILVCQGQALTTDAAAAQLPGHHHNDALSAA